MPMTTSASLYELVLPNEFYAMDFDGHVVVAVVALVPVVYSPLILYGAIYPAAVLATRESQYDYCYLHPMQQSKLKHQMRKDAMTDAQCVHSA
jgi:hypothetical protein